LNGRRRWSLGLHVRCCRKRFTFAISSPDEFLYALFLPSVVDCLILLSPAFYGNEWLLMWSHALKITYSLSHYGFFT